MRFRDWFHPPRHVLTIFLGVALVCGCALGWLAWLLLEQDKALEVQQRQERIEQAADRAVAVMQRALADLASHLRSDPLKEATLPPGVTVLTTGPGGILVQPHGALLYYPEPSALPEAQSQAFSEGEQREFAQQKLPEAARSYSLLMSASDEAVRAGALTRLARVYRKLAKPDAALRAYDRLSAISLAGVEGVPASLIAREGRTTLFEETHRASELRREAALLNQDLQQGRWHIARPQYEFYSGEVRAWLGTAPPENQEALARSESAEWIWSHWRHETSSPRLLRSTAGPTLVLGELTPDGLRAVVADAKYLAALCAEAAPDRQSRCALSDLEGHPVLGELPSGRGVAMRTAAVAKLPWTVHVFASPGSGGPGPSRRRQLLLLVVVVLAVVLVTGTYFTLRAISRELRVARLQSDFVAAVSHEFRTPLTSLCQISELLARDRFPTDDMRRKSYDVLARESERLRRLVEGLLDFGRFEAGAANYRFEALEIGAFVRTLVGDFQERVAGDGYSIEQTGLETEVYVNADREALSRALWNLLDNAVKYSPEFRTIWVEVSRAGDRVCIAVRDQGIGIPAGEQREVFQKFVRGADSKTLRIKGTGIGLAMVRQIAKAHGGEVQLASAPGQGSRFTLVLHAAGELP